jgi:hypothetical protein
VSGFVGSAGSTALAGGNLKESLKAGAIGGLVGGAGAGVFGGAEAFQAGSYTGPTTISGQIEKATDFLTGGGQEAALPDPAQAAAETVSGVQDAATAGFGDPLAAGPGGSLPSPVQSATSGGIETVMPSDPFAAGQAGMAPPVQPTAGAPVAGTAPPATTSGVPIVESVGVPGSNVAQLGVDNLGQSQNLLQRGLNKILPGRIEEATREGAFQKVADQFGTSADVIRNQIVNNTASDAVVSAYTKAATPSMLAKYAPLAATGLGVMGLTGGFKAEEPQIPEGFEGIMGTPGMDLLRQYPELYGLRFGGVQPMSTTSPYQTYTPRPVGAAKGGSMDRTEFPRKNGAINGPGTGTSDDIPAMLSDGEFVFTARAVRGMGDGSRRQGAKRMYAMMKKLENRANG